MNDLPSENVQDYPRPPAIEQIGQRLRVVLGGVVIADTTAGLRVLETHHAPTYYFPPQDVMAGVLKAAQGASYCEWKGAARYWTAQAGGEIRPRAAWSFSRPSKPFASLAGYLAFYSEPMDACFVGDQRVSPQPGSFYGGWVTPNLQGRIKGAPGTEFW
ncbi:DUF427 domain-containing protein [Rhodophyticola porphyridii]|uniref:DUF427 domain-containing protein n=1 Tax=Rhodophyticola porphyridii TaxID=1852017 RepID=A0A3L9YEA8_9RHOB|nr:DUF427 domain-containing protein [Rhodophyticola porphyridii]RMA41270.1 DUF427 domain-containing protein [Rhodophyticola porphyridii]